MARDLVAEKEWQARFEEYRKRGLSIKAWCTENGVKNDYFSLLDKKV